MVIRLQYLDTKNSPSGKIWVDDTFLKGPISGIVRDTKEIVQKFLGEDGYNVIDWPNHRIRNSRILWKIFTFAQLCSNQRLVVPSKYKGTLFQPQLGALLPGDGIDRWIVRLHDIFPVTNPKWFRKIDSSQFRKSLNRALEMKALFICDSVTSQKHLLDYAKDSGVNSIVQLCTTATLSDQLCESCVACTYIRLESLPKKFFLAVGTVEPRKNYSFALKFWKARHRDIYRLIIVGRPGWKSRFVQLKLSKNRVGILWLKSVCDGALKNLYLQSAGFISFSMNEGFDLPAMEAFSLGTPLILSDILVHRELHERTAHFFTTPDELELCIKTVIKVPD